MAEKKEECVQVVVRCRPFNSKEKAESRGNIINMDLEGNSIIIRNPDEEHLQPKPFTYDAVYDENTIQKNFYEESCSALVENVLEGFNGTIFAYGQTGCGKTWTMQGPPNPPELRGVIPNSFTHIFDFVKASQGVEFLVRCSYLEIYNEVVRDLLVDPKHAVKCDIKEDPNKGVFVSNLTDVVVESEREMEAVLDKGLNHRTVGATAMNAESSRSHSIFTVIIEMSTKDEATGKDHIRAGKLNLVDLAGSERQKKTGASGDRLKEGSKINLSLSALGNVISALSEGGAKHIPYRDSKLTRLLQDSLGGNTKTLMVAAISPADYNYDETLSTLRYANRAKNIKNKPKINEDPKDTMLREYKEEIEKLRKMLADQAAMLNGDPAALAAMMQMQSAFAQAHPTTTQVISHPKSGGVEDDEEVDFAALGSVSESTKQKLSPRPPRSPRPPNDQSHHDSRSPRVVEKIIQVVSEDQLNKQKELEQRSEAVERERDMYGEKLRVAEQIAEAEKAAKQELERRLEDMQRKLMGRSESVQELTGGVSQAPAGPSDAGALSLENYNFVTEPVIIEPAVVPGGGQSNMKESEAMVKEREAALVRIRERKRKAKKRSDNKLRAERERALKESNDIKEELDDLREVASDISQDKEQTEKKLARLKKKFERRIHALEQDKEELIEQFGIERDNMLDTIREQQQDMKLYEQICRTILSNKKMNQIMDKARWSDVDEEWTLPFFKADGDSGDSSGGSQLPDIGSGKSGGPSPKATSVGAPGIAFPRNISSESKNCSPNNTSLPPAFGKKQSVSKSGDEDDYCEDKKGGRRGKEGDSLQLPEFNQRTLLSNNSSVPASARSEGLNSRDGTPVDGDKKKKKKKKDKSYDEEKAKQALAAALDANDGEDNAGAVSEWGFAGNGHEDVERKQRKNKSSSGNRKSKETDSNQLPSINGAAGKGDVSPRSQRSGALPAI